MIFYVNHPPADDSREIPEFQLFYEGVFSGVCCSVIGIILDGLILHYLIDTIGGLR